MISSQTFTKKMSYFLPEQIQKIFENNERFFKASTTIPDLRIPEPKSFSATSIEFEWVEGLEKTFSTELHEGKLWDPSVFYKIGTSIGKLHTQQGNLKEKIFLHGDFLPHNIVVHPEELWFFDFEPPGTFNDFDYFYYNYNYVDLASFVFFVLISHYFKKPWEFLCNKRKYIQAFLKGYSEATHFQISKESLVHYLHSELAKWYKERKHSLPKKLLKYFFVCCIFFIQIRVYKVLS